MLRNNHQNQIFFLLSLPHFTRISSYNMVYHIFLNVSKTMVLYKSFSESKNIFFCMCVLPFNPCPIKHTGQHICAFVWVNKMDIYQKAGFVHMHKDKRLICWPKRLLHIYKQHTYTHTQKKVGVRIWIHHSIFSKIKCCLSKQKEKLCAQLKVTKMSSP